MSIWERKAKRKVPQHDRVTKPMDRMRKAQKVDAEPLDPKADVDWTSVQKAARETATQLRHWASHLPEPIRYEWQPATGGWTFTYQNVAMVPQTPTGYYASNTIDTTWAGWTTGTSTWTTTATVTPMAWQYWNDDVERTQEQIRELERQRQEAQARRDYLAARRAERMAQYEEEAQARREARSRAQLALAPIMEKANERATELLHMLLSAEEKIHLLQHNEIKVRAQSGKLYCIQMGRGVHGNIYEIDEHGCKLSSLCVAPAMYDEHDDHPGVQFGMPIEDGIVGQYLALKFNEQALLARANRSAFRQCQHRDVPILGATEVDEDELDMYFEDEVG